MAYQFLTTRRDGSVEYLTLNRPEARNAFNEHVIAELSRWCANVPAEVRDSGLSGRRHRVAGEDRQLRGRGESA
jgi:enoyl-CoA hydratase/carnithine racemase